MARKRDQNPLFLHFLSNALLINFIGPGVFLFLFIYILLLFFNFLGELILVCFLVVCMKHKHDTDTRHDTGHDTDTGTTTSIII